MCVSVYACVCSLCTDGFRPSPLPPLCVSPGGLKWTNESNYCDFPLFWLMLGQHGLWQPFAHWRVCGISAPTVVLHREDPFLPFQNSFVTEWKWCFRPHLEWMMLSECWSLAQAAALRLGDAGHNVRESESCSPCLRVSRWFQASIKKNRPVIRFDEQRRCMRETTAAVVYNLC